MSHDCDVTVKSTSHECDMTVINTVLHDCDMTGIPVDREAFCCSSMMQESQTRTGLEDEERFMLLSEQELQKMPPQALQWCYRTRRRRGRGRQQRGRDRGGVGSRGGGTGEG